jgi:peroxiredoxin
MSSMSSRKTLLLAFGLILSVILSGWITERRHAVAAADAIDGQLDDRPIGQAAPDFQLRAVDGHEVKLSDYRRRTVIVAFWATWCGPCLAEMPELVNFYRQQGGNVELLAVSMDDNIEDAKAYADENHLPFPVLFDSKGRVAGGYAVEGIPALFIVGPAGTVRAHHEGLIPSLDTVLASELPPSQDSLPQNGE